MSACLQAALLAVLATHACGEGVFRVCGLFQSSGHGANGRKAVEAWASWWESWAVDNAPEYTLETSFGTWNKSNAAALVGPRTTKEPTRDADLYCNVLFGPYGSGDNIAMINEVDPSFDGVILVWGGSSDSIFTSACASLGRCFGTLTTASQYMTSGINAVDVASTDTVQVALLVNNNVFSKSVAAGVNTTIEGSAGVELAYYAQLDAAKAALSESDEMMVRNATSAEPDLYVIAGHNKDVEPVITMIGSSGVVPHAILATNSITSTALANFGDMEKYANCIMMPTQWAEADGIKDDLVGWTSADFKEIMGTAATYHSASAAAASIAISHALRAFYAAEGLDWLQAWKALNFESFYGKISFNDNGEILKPMYTQQKQEGGNVIVAPASGVTPGNSMRYPLSNCSGWDDFVKDPPQSLVSFAYMLSPSANCYAALALAFFMALSVSAVDQSWT